MILPKRVEPPLELGHLSLRRRDVAQIPEPRHGAIIAGGAAPLDLSIDLAPRVVSAGGHRREPQLARFLLFRLAPFALRPRRHLGGAPAFSSNLLRAFGASLAALSLPLSGVRARVGEFDADMRIGVMEPQEQFRALFIGKRVDRRLHGGVFRFRVRRCAIALDPAN